MTCKIVDVCLTAQAHATCCFYFTGKLSQLKFSFCDVGIMKFQNNCNKIIYCIDILEQFLRKVLQEVLLKLQASMDLTYVLKPDG